MFARGHVFVECLLDHEAAGVLVALLLNVVPNAIAAQNHELHVGAVDLHDVGLAAYRLRESIYRRCLLEFEIAERSGYGQLSINAPLLDKATRFLNSRLFHFVFWLVINRKCFALASLVSRIFMTVGRPVSTHNRT